jgi:hypothetical protein
MKALSSQLQLAATKFSMQPTINTCNIQANNTPADRHVANEAEFARLEKEADFWRTWRPWRLGGSHAD